MRDRFYTIVGKLTILMLWLSFVTAFFYVPGMYFGLLFAMENAETGYQHEHPYFVIYFCVSYLLGAIAAFAGGRKIFRV